MNVLFITNNFPPIVDGVGDYTYHLAKVFLSQKHRVLVVCHKNKQIKSIENIQVYAIIEKWNQYAITPLINIINNENIDIVLLQYVPHAFQRKGLPYQLIKILDTIKKNSRVKIFTFCHEVAVETKGLNLKQMILSLTMKYITKQVVKKSDWVSTSIGYYKSMLLKMDSSKDIRTIPIASNVPSCEMSESELNILRSKIAPNNEIIVSFFGIRNLENSLKAINLLIAKGYKIKPLIIGKTSGKVSIPEFINVYKTGILDLDQIDRYFKITDIMILPESKDFGCSFKSGSLSAALCNGLPVITSKGAATSEKLVSMKNIVFTDFTNERLVANILQKLIESQSLRFIIGRNAKELSKDLSWENTYESYMRVCNNEL